MMFASSADDALAWDANETALNWKACVCGSVNENMYPWREGFSNPVTFFVEEENKYEEANKAKKKRTNGVAIADGIVT